MDCSTEGQSDKRLIYIGSIRNIEEIFDEDDDPYYDLTQEEKIIKSYSDLQTAIESINLLVEQNENNTPTQSNSENALYFPPPPPPPPQEHGPYIIGARPAPPPPPPQNPEFPIVIDKNKQQISQNIDFNKLIDKLDVIKDMLNSFITEYINKENENNTSDDNNCDCDNQENNG